MPRSGRCSSAPGERAPACYRVWLLLSTVTGCSLPEEAFSLGSRCRTVSVLRPYQRTEALLGKEAANPASKLKRNSP